MIHVISADMQFHTGFLSQYNAYQNLLYLANINNKISKEDVKESIRMVGLDPGSNKKVGKFSLGMRPRLGIAQVIMENPPSMAHNALPHRPWWGISVFQSIILHYLSSFAIQPL